MSIILKRVAMMGGVMLCISAQAAFVNLNTGRDANSDYIDDNWKLVSIEPSNPPGNESLPNAYLTTAHTGFPFGSWVANNNVSSWITYSNPLYVAGDSGRNFTYRLEFFSSGGIVPVRWLSDNSSTLKLDNVVVGTKGTATYTSWGTPLNLNLGSGMHTLDLIVFNAGQGSGNPTGARVEFVGGIPVPEPTTMIAGALLLLPFGASTLRILRKKRVA
jgi:hypothetical protein